MNYGTTVIVTVIAVVAGAEAKSNAQGDGFTMQPVAAGFVLGAFLLAGGMLNENLATKICWLIIVGALVVNGRYIFNSLTPKEKVKAK